MPMAPEDVLLYTQTGPGTPGGQLLRSYWQPVALSRELSPGGRPLQLRVMGEDLVLFRGRRGRLGLLGLFCPHRGANLSYGRVEDDALRCLYHGWAFGCDGVCVEQPGEPTEERSRKRATRSAYPCAERAGVVLAYLGEGRPPPLPPFAFLHAPPEATFATKLFHRCNFQQGNEGNVDPQHVSVLHRDLDNGLDQAIMTDGRPRIDVEEMPHGLRIVTSRSAGEGTELVRFTNYLFPNAGTFPGVLTNGGYQVHWHVPVDDHSHWKFVIVLAGDGHADVARAQANLEREMDERWHSARTAANRYLQDAVEMELTTFAGFGANIQLQDLAVVEQLAPLAVREEQLGYTDRALTRARAYYLQRARAIGSGSSARDVTNGGSYGETDELLTEETVLAPGVSWQEYCRLPAGAR